VKILKRREAALIAVGWALADAPNAAARTNFVHNALYSCTQNQAATAQNWTLAVTVRDG